jgi:drug/metabolite transporter (DMT)-like permease
LCVATLVLLALSLRAPATWRVDRKQRIVLFFAGLALAMHFATWIASLEYTTVAVSVLLVATTPIWTAAYDAIVHRRPLTRLAAVAFFIGGAGVAAVVGFDRTPPPVAHHEVLGAALAIAGSIAFGGYLILVREVRAALTTQTIVTHTYAWAAVALVLLAALAHQPPPAIGNATAWSGILGMALISQLLGHTAMNASLRWFTPSAVSFSNLLEPPIAAAIAFAVFHEAVAPLAIAGAVAVLAALAIVLREEPRTAA